MADHLDYLDITTWAWNRPPGSPFRVWRVVEGRKKAKDGGILKFSIQDIPEDRYEEVLDFMCEYFLTDEPICSSLKLTDDALAVQEFRTLWRSTMRQGIAVVALMDNPEGGKPLIAGANMLFAVTPKDEVLFESLEFKSDTLRIMMPVVFGFNKEADVCTKFGVESYITALGLCVLPSLRGQGLGEHILRVREDIGREFLIPVTETIFTATASQIVADRAGFEVLIEEKYSKIVNDRGERIFPVVNVESLKIMARKLC